MPVMELARSLERISDKGVVFVDSGSITVRRPSAEVSIVKLAVLRSFAEREELLFPVPSGRKEGLPPYFIATVGDRGRQGLSYLIEIASLLALSNGSDKIFIKHGPLVQQLMPYFSNVYDVDVGVLRSALGYAGLDVHVINEIVESARLQTDSSKANIGLASLEILRMLRERDNIYAGVVEDVSYSRTLIHSVIGEILVDVLKSISIPHDKEEVLIRRVAREIRDVSEAFYDRLDLEVGVERCFCERVFNEIDNLADIEDYVYSLSRELRRFRLYRGLVEVKDLVETGDEEEALGLLEASSSSVGYPAGYSDTDLIYGLTYLLLKSVNRRENFYATAVRRRLSTMRGAIRSLCEEEVNAFRLLGTARRDESCRRLVIDSLKGLKYRYVLPEMPLSCRELNEHLSSHNIKSLRPCDIAGLISIPPAIRVEWVGENKDLVSDLLNIISASSSITMYKYPSQLLLVDKASRVSRDESGIVSEIIRDVARRRRPYTGFIRGWRSRILLA